MDDVLAITARTFTYVGVITQWLKRALLYIT